MLHIEPLKLQLSISIFHHFITGIFVFYLVIKYKMGDQTTRPGPVKLFNIFLHELLQLISTARQNCFRNQRFT